MAMYVIALDQGDYYQARGGFDWGRSDRRDATMFETHAEAQAEIGRALHGYLAAKATVEEID